jgi:hypothetical protein
VKIEVAGTPNGSSAVTYSSVYTRHITVGTSQYSRLPVWVDALYTNLSPATQNGDYTVTMSVRLLANGTMTIDLPYIVAQGSPVQYGGATTIVGTQTSLCPTCGWILLASVPFANNSSGNVETQLQASLQFVSGNPGDQILLGLGFDNVSSNGHNSIVYVPSQFPDGVNVFDYLPHEGVTTPLSPGSHTLQLWAKNNGGSATTTVTNAQVQGVGFPVTNGHQFYTTTVLGPTTFNTSAVVEPQPLACAMLDTTCNYPADNLIRSVDGKQHPGFGDWVMLAETNTADPNTTEGNVSGGGYIELLGHDSDPSWANTDWYQLAVELVGNNANDGTAIDWSMPVDPNHKPLGIEIGTIQSYVPAGTSQLYFHLDAMQWGNGNGGYKARLWMRRVKNTPGQASTAGSFTVGRRYFAVRWTPTTYTTQCP